METLVFGLNKRHLAFLLPIREAYEWKQLVVAIEVIYYHILLPIREAYEWKQ